MNLLKSIRQNVTFGKSKRTLWSKEYPTATKQRKDRLRRLLGAMLCIAVILEVMKNFATSIPLKYV